MGNITELRTLNFSLKHAKTDLESVRTQLKMIKNNSDTQNVIIFLENQKRVLAGRITNIYNWIAIANKE